MRNRQVFETFPLGEAQQRTKRGGMDSWCQAGPPSFRAATFARQPYDSRKGKCWQRSEGYQERCPRSHCQHSIGVNVCIVPQTKSSQKSLSQVFTEGSGMPTNNRRELLSLNARRASLRLDCDRTSASCPLLANHGQSAQSDN